MPHNIVEIRQQMEAYFKNVLEIPQKAFGGLPPCPFIRAERLADKIRYSSASIASGEPSEQVKELISQFQDDQSHSTLLIIDPTTEISISDGISYGMRLCELFEASGIVSISLHPEDDFSVDGLKPRCVPFFTILVQEGIQIAKAKKELVKSLYYSRWTESELKFNYQQFGRFLNTDS